MPPHRLFPVAAVVLLCAGLRAAAPAQPNIVFLLADDLRWDALSCAGHPVLKTPHIDRLAAQGTRFTNAFLTTAICCVSRASALTGQYARRHGVNDFKTPLRSLAETYPVRLRAADYYTGFIGKWGVAASDRDYFRESAAAFDFWAGDMGQSAYWHERTCQYIASNATSERTRLFCSCPPAARQREGVQGAGPHPALHDPVHAETEFMPAKIRSFLDQRANAKPFCLSVSFKAPHGPWGGYAPRFAKDFEGVDIPRAASVTAEEALRQPAFLRASLGSSAGLRYAQDASLDGDRNRQFRNYYRLIEGVDFCVGELLRELEQRGLASNTIIIFTSDNGQFAGEHGFTGKWLMYEESIRAPMIVLDPRAPAAQRGQICDALVLNVDVAPTILDFAGMATPPAMQGKCLRPLLREPGRAFREDFFYEHHYDPGPSRHIERSEGVRGRDWKYIVYLDQTGPAREELYDLRTDKLEMKNLAADPAWQNRLRAAREQHRQFTLTLP
ncbi:MAG: sulfatase [Opitutaceae bacterium]